MKNAYLHIGLEKCASTSLQQALRQLVPADDLYTLDFKLLHKSHAETIYLSDERFSWIGSLELNEIVRTLKKLDYKIFPCLIVRNPVKYITSLYFEAIKWGETRAFDDFVLGNLDLVDYKKRISEIEVVLGEKLKIFNLSPSVVNEVLLYFNLHDDYKVTTENVRLGNDLTGILRSVNIYFNNVLNDKDMTCLVSQQVLELLERLSREHSVPPTQILYPTLSSMSSDTLSKLLDRLVKTSSIEYMQITF